jgi:defect-in-organelle-trafficking protein DotC
MSEPTRLRALLCAATLLTGLALGAPAWAEDADAALLNSPIPPKPAAATVDAASRVLANPRNQPVTGAAISPTIVGGQRPLSLETLQAARPGVNPSGELSGARGGPAARGFAINEMLRRYEAKLDSSYDFRSLVVQVGRGQTLMRPPIVTKAQMAFALGDGGQTARETGRVYQITRQAQFSPAPPDWRTYLVRSWVNPTPPLDDLRPRTSEEAGYWNKWVAEGWARGERKAVEIYQSDLSRLEADLIGIARYRVLLRARLVEQPRVVFARRAVEGGRDRMRVDDTQIEIRAQPGLNPNRRSWRGTGALPSDIPAGRPGLMRLNP